MIRALGFHASSIEKLADLFLEKRIRAEEMSESQRREVNDVILRRANAEAQMTTRRSAA